ncbi:NADP-dependent oxidoreductase [Flindersiella endophytica]
MKAAAFEAFGPPEVLKLTDLPDPHAGPGQVRVKVKAAGVQPYDIAVRAGNVPPTATVHLPGIPGNEFAGIVDEIGADVAGIATGDEVLGFGTLLSYAEYVVVPADQVTPKPAGMPWEVAGGFTAGGQTADIALSQLAIQPGEVVAVHGAAGNVGTFAVQLAHLAGAGLVIGTARPDNHDYLRDLGAIPVAYGEGLADRIRTLAPTGIDAAIDAAGGDALRVALEVANDPHRIVTLVEHAKAAELGVQTTQNLRSAQRLGRLAKLYDDGKLAFHVRRTYSLAEAAGAHREMETGHGRGKIVLTI